MRSAMLTSATSRQAARPVSLVPLAAHDQEPQVSNRRHYANGGAVRRRSASSNHLADGTKWHSGGLAQRRKEFDNMKAIFMAAVLASALTLAPGAADARGCIKGAVAGGVAGHFAHHTFMGAIGGCVAGHYASKALRERQERQQQLAPAAPAAPPGQ
jgi:hypothetical protein